MRFIRFSTVLMMLSAILAAASLVAVITPGPRLSIEFTGGTLMEFALPEGKTRDDLLVALRSANAPLAESAVLSKTTTDTFFVRTQSLTNEEHLALFDGLSKAMGDGFQELQFTTIGPSVGASLRTRSIVALVAASIAIVLYLAVMFRSMSRSVSSWSFGVAAIIAVMHDVLVTTGIFVVLSYTTSFQLDTLFVTALLSIMGYSVNDTIVIFDRIRDNLLLEGKRRPFADLAVDSLKQSLRRTLNTGVGALIMLFALFLFGAESIRWFTLALILGTVIGTYSSFFIATPLVVLWQQREASRR